MSVNKDVSDVLIIDLRISATAAHHAHLEFRQDRIIDMTQVSFSDTESIPRMLKNSDWSVS